MNLGLRVPEMSLGVHRVEEETLTMICPISLFGMLLNWISLIATVSPVAQLRAPLGIAVSSVFVSVATWGEMTYGKPDQTLPFQENRPIATPPLLTSQDVKDKGKNSRMHRVTCWKKWRKKIWGMLRLA